MIRSILSFGAIAALHAAAKDAGGGLLINDSDIPRFTAAGVLVEPGKPFPASELHTKEYVAKSTPVGNLTDEQVLALAASRGLVPHNPQAPASEPAAADVAPRANAADLDALDERREQVAEEAAGGDVKLASDAINPPDRDGDGKPGGSMTKAEIAAELTDLKVEFDPKASRDDLGRLLDAERAKAKA